MKIRITVSHRGIAPSAAVQSEIVAQVKRLERTEADILRCHVYLHRCDEKPVERYQVDVRLTMRGGDTIDSRATQEKSVRDDVEVALRIAFEDVAEQLAATRLRRYQPSRRERVESSGW
jgi:ribosome-associated translation inhibitor RaiA